MKVSFSRDEDGDVNVHCTLDCPMDRGAVAFLLIYFYRYSSKEIMGGGRTGLENRFSIRMGTVMTMLGMNAYQRTPEEHRSAIINDFSETDFSERSACMNWRLRKWSYGLITGGVTWEEMEVWVEDSGFSSLVLPEFKIPAPELLMYGLKLIVDIFQQSQVDEVEWQQRVIESPHIRQNTGWNR